MTDENKIIIRDSEESDVSWVLVGVRPRDEEKLPEETLQRMMEDSFSEGKVYKLFLCGVEVDKEGTLDEMEEGFKMVKKNMDEYNDGDYCIISRHEEGDLLFLPVILEDDAKEVSGNTDSLQ